MRMSDSIANLADAAVTALSEIGHPTKNKVNPHFKNRYADLLNVVDASREALLKHGLWVVQVPDQDGLTTMLIHKSGEFIAFESFMPDQPQKFGSGFTYMRRYSQQGLMDIVAEDDDDAEATRETTNKNNEENW